MENKEVCDSAPSVKEDIKDVNEFVQSLDPEMRDKFSKVMYAIEEHKAFCGPLPAPEDFRAYKSVLSNAPERIISMAEQQIKHRIEIEKKIVESGITESRHGQYLGALIVLLCLLGSVYLGMNGHDWLAGSMIAIIATVGTIFVLHKEPDKTDH